MTRAERRRQARKRKKDEERGYIIPESTKYKELEEFELRGAKPVSKPNVDTPPCMILKYCPYGWLVEFFPLNGKKSTWDGVTIDHIKVRPNAVVCPKFGHDCPAQYAAENVFKQDQTIQFAEIKDVIHKWIKSHSPMQAAFYASFIVFDDKFNVIDDIGMCFGLKKVIKLHLTRFLEKVDKEKDDFVVW